MAPTRLAVVCSHPIQYYAPWFVDLARRPELKVKVFYLWDFGVTDTLDREFGRVIKWDIPLLNDYDLSFVPNTSSDPGTHHFFGLRNPDLLKQIDAFAPHAVLLLSYNFFATLELILRRWRRWPLIFRGDSNRLTKRHGIKDWLKARLVSSIFSRLRACLYVGMANREYFLQHGVASNKLFFAPHSIDVERFANARVIHAQAALKLREQLGLIQSDRLALFVGKLEWQKDPHTLLAAFSQLEDQRFHLLIVGDGALEPKLKASAPPRTHFLGFQNQLAMPSVYAAAEVLLLPSVSETWGLVINEALAAGTPVIVSDQVGCHFDLVENGESGFVVPAGDSQALAVALERVLSDDALREKFRLRGTQIAQRYTYAHATDGLLRVLDL